ncbi:hypothetical protein VP01_1569g3 [Puccinia sorghi]|uniref:Uncharacterized protein n=1 Tax=Puccinia sorghi TaxID=27349 RepID=A0A0L6VIG2_9BASI|nr:hypothetical protein VP01_1569g3 [Puccinia sorghi]
MALNTKFHELSPALPWLTGIDANPIEIGKTKQNSPTIVLSLKDNVSVILTCFAAYNSLTNIFSSMFHAAQVATFKKFLKFNPDNHTNPVRWN